jgi:pimeloyl-ACP methyl ester carboxylesterase
MPKVKVNGINLYYESQGQGYPVIFTHGFSATHAMWRPQLPAISKEFHFITYDARGHGDTDSPDSAGQYSADIVVEDLYQLMGVLGIKKAVIGGLSMGGYISLRFYFTHPDMATALVIMDTGPGYRNPQRRDEWNRTRIEQAIRLQNEGIGVLLNEALTEARKELLRRQDPFGLAYMSRKVVAQYDSWVIDSLGRIQVPSLILVGEKDTAFLQAGQYMAKTIPGAEHVVVPGAGHAANVDNTEFFNNALLNFLRKMNLPKNQM